MTEQALYHMPESKYCFAADERTIVLRLRIAKEDFPDRIDVVYGGKYDFMRAQSRAEMTRFREDRLYAYYTVSIRPEDVRFVYVFEIAENGRVRYFSEDGLTERYDFSLSYYNCFQLAYINEADIHRVVPWMKTATFYQIFVDRFCAGNDEKDRSYIDLKWGDVPDPKSFAGGDIRGITSKLDYLADLGINAFYLTPLFRSISNHKYDISNYYEIDGQFGDKADLEKLVRKAHSRGIRVVIDAVFNHCSDRLAEFQDVVKNGRASRFHDWFVIRGDRPTADPLNYECFASCAYMPKFDTSNPEVQRYLLDIAVYWIREFDIDGWRLDVSDEVSHDFWRRFRKEVKAAKADCVIIGENWHDANPYLHGDQYDGIMNYAFTKACLDLFAFGAHTPQETAWKMNELLMRNTDAVNEMMLNLLDSHDTHRFLTQTGGDAEKLASALAVLYFYPGAPCLYYGTENAMEGGYDPDCRRTMDWDLAARNTPLKALIRLLASLKHGDCMRDGRAAVYEKDGLLYLERYGARRGLRLVVNQCGEARPLAEDGLLWRQNYRGGKLYHNGFTISTIESGGIADE